VLYRKDRSKKESEGLDIYVRSDISSRIIVPHPICINDCSHTEILWVECIYNVIKDNVAGCCHPPKPRYDDNVLQTELSRDLEMLLCSPLILSDIESQVIVIAGDFK
jgi:hypothetical protein